MTRLTRRALGLLGSFVIFALVSACGSASNDLTESSASAPAAATQAAAAPSDSLLPAGTYRTPELTREQLIATAVQAGFTGAQAEQALTLERIKHTATFTLTLERGTWTQSFTYDGTRDGVGFEATYKVSDDSTVVVTEPDGYQTIFEYELDGDAVRISFKDPDPIQMCHRDAKCPMGIMVWQSAPFSRT